MRTALPLFVAACVLSTSCVLDVDADIPPIEITERGITVPGNPLGAALGDVPLSATFNRSVGKLGLPAGFLRDVRVLDVTVSSVDGTTDLGFIRTLRVLVRGTGAAVATMPPAEVAAYRRAGAAAGTRLVATSAASTNLIEHWNAQPLQFIVEVSGEMPRAAWTVDVTMRLSVSVDP